MTYISQYMAPESVSPLACENVSSGFLMFPKSRQRDNFTREDIWSAIVRKSGSYVITDIHFDKKILNYSSSQVLTPVSALACSFRPPPPPPPPPPTLQTKWRPH